MKKAIEEDKKENDQIPKWELMQMKTFNRWVNAKLKNMNEVFQNLEIEFRDGIKLIKLLQVLSGDSVGVFNKKVRNEIQMRENIITALNYLKKENIKLVNIGPEDIFLGNRKLILGLIWTLICHYQISMYQEPEPVISVSQEIETEKIEQKSEINIQETIPEVFEKLEQKTQIPTIEQKIQKQPEQKVVKEPAKPKPAPKKPKKNISEIVTSFVINKIKYSNLKIKQFKNFKTDWNDGALITNFIQNYVRDIEVISKDKEYTKDERIAIVEAALNEVEKRKNVDKIIDAAEIISDNIDDKALLTYISSFMSVEEEKIKAKIYFDKDEIHIGDKIDVIIDVSVPLGSNDVLSIEIIDEDENISEIIALKIEDKKYLAKVFVKQSFNVNAKLNGEILSKTSKKCEAHPEIIKNDYQSFIKFYPETVVKGENVNIQMEVTPIPKDDDIIKVYTKINNNLDELTFNKLTDGKYEINYIVNEPFEVIVNVNDISTNNEIVEFNKISEPKVVHEIQTTYSSEFPIIGELFEIILEITPPLKNESDLKIITTSISETLEQNVKKTKDGIYTSSFIPKEDFDVKYEIYGDTIPNLINKFKVSKPQITHSIKTTCSSANPIIGEPFKLDFEITPSLKGSDDMKIIVTTLSEIKKYDVEEIENGKYTKTFNPIENFTIEIEIDNEIVSEKRQFEVIEPPIVYNIKLMCPTATPTIGEDFEINLEITPLLKDVSEMKVLVQYEEQSLIKYNVEQASNDNYILILKPYKNFTIEYEIKDKIISKKPYQFNVVEPWVAYDIKETYSPAIPVIGEEFKIEFVTSSPLKNVDEFSVVVTYEDGKCEEQKVYQIDDMKYETKFIPQQNFKTQYKIGDVIKGSDKEIFNVVEPWVAYDIKETYSPAIPVIGEEFKIEFVTSSPLKNVDEFAVVVTYEDGKCEEQKVYQIDDMKYETKFIPQQNFKTQYKIGDVIKGSDKEIFNVVEPWVAYEIKETYSPEIPVIGEEFKIEFVTSSPLKNVDEFAVVVTYEDGKCEEQKVYQIDDMKYETKFIPQQNFKTQYKIGDVIKGSDKEIFNVVEPWVAYDIKETYSPAIPVIGEEFKIEFVTSSPLKNVDEFAVVVTYEDGKCEEQKVYQIDDMKYETKFIPQQNFKTQYKIGDVIKGSDKEIFNVVEPWVAYDIKETYSPAIPVIGEEFKIEFVTSSPLKNVDEFAVVVTYEDGKCEEQKVYQIDDMKYETKFIPQQNFKTQYKIGDVIKGSDKEIFNVVEPWVAYDIKETYSPAIPVIGEEFKIEFVTSSPLKNVDEFAVVVTYEDGKCEEQKVYQIDDMKYETKFIPQQNFKTQYKIGDVIKESDKEIFNVVEPWVAYDIKETYSPAIPVIGEEFKIEFVTSSPLKNVDEFVVVVTYEDGKCEEQKVYQIDDMKYETKFIPQQNFKTQYKIGDVIKGSDKEIFNVVEPWVAYEIKETYSPAIPVIGEEFKIEFVTSSPLKNVDEFVVVVTYEDGKCEEQKVYQIDDMKYETKFIPQQNFKTQYKIGDVIKGSDKEIFNVVEPWVAYDIKETYSPAIPVIGEEFKIEFVTSSPLKNVDEFAVVVTYEDGKCEEQKVYQIDDMKYETKFIPQQNFKTQYKIGDVIKGSDKEIFNVVEPWVAYDIKETYSPAIPVIGEEFKIEFVTSSPLKNVDEFAVVVTYEDGKCEEQKVYQIDDMKYETKFVPYKPFNVVYKFCETMANVKPLIFNELEIPIIYDVKTFVSHEVPVIGEEYTMEFVCSPPLKNPDDMKLVVHYEAGNSETYNVVENMSGGYTTSFVPQDKFTTEYVIGGKTVDHDESSVTIIEPPIIYDVKTFVSHEVPVIGEEYTMEFVCSPPLKNPDDMKLVVHYEAGNSETYNVVENMSGGYTTSFVPQDKFTTEYVIGGKTVDHDESSVTIIEPPIIYDVKTFVSHEVPVIGEEYTMEFVCSPPLKNPDDMKLVVHYEAGNSETYNVVENMSGGYTTSFVPQDKFTTEYVIGGKTVDHDESSVTIIEPPIIYDVKTFVSHEVPVIGEEYTMEFVCSPPLKNPDDMKLVVHYEAGNSETYNVVENMSGGYTTSFVPQDKFTTEYVIGGKTVDHDESSVTIIEPPIIYDVKTFVSHEVPVIGEEYTMEFVCSPPLKNPDDMKLVVHYEAGNSETYNVVENMSGGYTTSFVPQDKFTTEYVIGGKTVDHDESSVTIIEPPIIYDVKTFVSHEVPVIGEEYTMEFVCSPPLKNPDDMKLVVHYEAGNSETYNVVENMSGGYTTSFVPQDKFTTEYVIGGKTVDHDESSVTIIEPPIIYDVKTFVSHEVPVIGEEYTMEFVCSPPLKNPDDMKLVVHYEAGNSETYNVVENMSGGYTTSFVPQDKFTTEYVIGGKTVDHDESSVTIIEPPIIYDVKTFVSHEVPVIGEEYTMEFVCSPPLKNPDDMKLVVHYEAGNSETYNVVENMSGGYTTSFVPQDKFTTEYVIGGKTVDHDESSVTIIEPPIIYDVKTFVSHEVPVIGEEYTMEFVCSPPLKNPDDMKLVVHYEAGNSETYNVVENMSGGYTTSFVPQDKFTTEYVIGGKTVDHDESSVTIIEPSIIYNRKNITTNIPVIGEEFLVEYSVVPNITNVSDFSLLIKYDNDIYDEKCFDFIDNDKYTVSFIPKDKFCLLTKFKNNITNDEPIFYDPFERIGGYLISHPYKTIKPVIGKLYNMIFEIKPSLNSIDDLHILIDESTGNSTTFNLNELNDGIYDISFVPQSSFKFSYIINNSTPEQLYKHYEAFESINQFDITITSTPLLPLMNENFKLDFDLSYPLKKPNSLSLLLTYKNGKKIEHNVTYIDDTHYTTTLISNAKFSLQYVIDGKILEKSPIVFNVVEPVKNYDLKSTFLPEIPVIGKEFTMNIETVPSLQSNDLKLLVCKKSGEKHEIKCTMLNESLYTVSFIPEEKFSTCYMIDGNITNDKPLKFKVIKPDINYVVNIETEPNDLIIGESVKINVTIDPIIKKGDDLVILVENKLEKKKKKHKLVENQPGLYLTKIQAKRELCVDVLLNNKKISKEPKIITANDSVIDYKATMEFFPVVPFKNEKCELVVSLKPLVENINDLTFVVTEKDSSVTYHFVKKDKNRYATTFIVQNIATGQLFIKKREIGENSISIEPINRPIKYNATFISNEDAVIKGVESEFTLNITPVPNSNDNLKLFMVENEGEKTLIPFVNSQTVSGQYNVNFISNSHFKIILTINDVEVFLPNSSFKVVEPEMEYNANIVYNPIKYKLDDNITIKAMITPESKNLKVFAQFIGKKKLKMKQEKDGSYILKYSSKMGNEFEIYVNNVKCINSPFKMEFEKEQILEYDINVSCEPPQPSAGIETFVYTKVNPSLPSLKMLTLFYEDDIGNRKKLVIEKNKNGSIVAKCKPISNFKIYAIINDVPHKNSPFNFLINKFLNDSHVVRYSCIPENPVKDENVCIRVYPIPILQGNDKFMLIIDDDDKSESDKPKLKKLKSHNDNSFSISFVPHSNFTSKIIINDVEIMGAKRYFRVLNSKNVEAVFKKCDKEPDTSGLKFDVYINPPPLNEDELVVISGESKDNEFPIKKVVDGFYTVELPGPDDNIQLRSKKGSLNIESKVVENSESTWNDNELILPPTNYFEPFNNKRGSYICVVDMDNESKELSDTEDKSLSTDTIQNEILNSKLKKEKKSKTKKKKIESNQKVLVEEKLDESKKEKLKEKKKTKHKKNQNLNTLEKLTKSVEPNIEKVEKCVVLGEKCLNKFGIPINYDYNFAIEYPQSKDLDISKTILKLSASKSNKLIFNGVRIGKMVGLYVIRVENVGKYNLTIENEKREILFEKEINVTSGDIKNIDAEIITKPIYQVGNPLQLLVDIRSSGYKSYEISYEGPNHLEIIKDEIIEGFSYVYVLPNLPGNYDLYFGRNRISHINSIKFKIEPIDQEDLESSIPIFEFGRHVQTKKVCKIPSLTTFGFDKNCINYPNIQPKPGIKYDFDFINSSMQDLTIPIINKTHNTVQFTLNQPGLYVLRCKETVYRGDVVLWNKVINSKRPLMIPKNQMCKLREFFKNDSEIGKLNKPLKIEIISANNKSNSEVFLSVEPKPCVYGIYYEIPLLERDSGLYCLRIFDDTLLVKEDTFTIEGKSDYWWLYIMAGTTACSLAYILK